MTNRPILEPILNDLKTSENKLDKAIEILRIMNKTNYAYDVNIVNAVVSLHKGFK